jgi:hypothetical protein
MADIKKTIAMSLGAIFALVLPLVTTDHALSPVEWINFGIAVLAVISTYVIPNLDITIARYAKQIIAGLLAVLTLVPDLIGTGFTLSEWLQVLVVFLGAAGVIALPGPIWTNATPVASTRSVHRIQ